MAVDALTLECFLEYGIGMSFLFLRFFARIRTYGLHHFELDDVFTGLAMIFYSAMTALIYLLSMFHPDFWRRVRFDIEEYTLIDIIDKFGNNIGLTPEKAMEIPDNQVPDLVIGSKLAFTNWIWYMSYIWCLKGVLLCLYSKLTMGLWQHRLVKIMSVFAVVSYLACVLSHICICTPVSKGWQVKPYPGDNCTIRKPNYIVIAVMNVLTDIGILVIPFPILWIAKIPIYRKIVLSLLFSTGIFIMICTLLRAYYSLKSIQTLTIALGWASRECFVAAITVTCPTIKSLFTQSSWLHSSSNRSKNKSTDGTGRSSRLPWVSKNASAHINSTNASRTDDGKFELSSVGWRRNQHAKRLSSTGSEERIIQPEKQDEIRVTTEYSLMHEQPNAHQNDRSMP
ncbi:hypothetical protein FQN54_001864 [Arachnomyces sp. PD_36]|nr:hypothetical protein FQN54_001864 [Arachnomyces sp. PD_36]